MRIYIAGKYSNKNIAEIKKNIEKAKKIAIKLQEMGHQPYCPHTHTGLWEKTNYASYETMMELHTGILKKWAEALIKISSSNGADIEEKIAKQKGIPIYYNIQEIENITQKTDNNRKKYLEEEEKIIGEIIFE